MWHPPPRAPPPWKTPWKARFGANACREYNFSCESCFSEISINNTNVHEILRKLFAVFEFFGRQILMMYENSCFYHEISFWFP